MPSPDWVVLAIGILMIVLALADYAHDWWRRHR